MKKKSSPRILTVMTHKEFMLTAIKTVICHAWVFDVYSEKIN